mgnify:CR=1 FL=1
MKESKMERTVHAGPTNGWVRLFMATQEDVVIADVAECRGRAGLALLEGSHARRKDTS